MKWLNLYILSHVDIDDIVQFLTRVEDSEGRSLWELGNDNKSEIEKLVWISGALEEFGLMKQGVGALELTTEGQSFLASGVEGRKAIIRRRLEENPYVRDLITLILGAKHRRIEVSQLLDRASEWFQGTSPYPLLRGLISWGRYAGILDVDSETDEIFLVNGAPEAKPSCFSRAG